jgi:hypothetical protein
MRLRHLFLNDASRAALAAALLVCAAWGCGTTQNRTATEQLVTSDAVDRAIASIDFSHLSGQKVFLEVEYLRAVKGVGTVNAEYIISSLRQQILASGCLLQENKLIADYIIEARVGALGLDGHEVVYGIPANNALGAASSFVPTAPAALPAIPELALAKRNDQMGAAKIGAFAYHRVTREVVWQSGISQSRSTSRDSWLVGIGPFQSGTILKDPKLMGSRFSPLPITSEEHNPEVEEYAEARVYKKERNRKRPTLFESPEVSPLAKSLPAAPAGVIQQISGTAAAPAPVPAAPAPSNGPALAELPTPEMDPTRPAPASFPQGGPPPRSLPPNGAGSRPYSLRDLDSLFTPK